MQDKIRFEAFSYDNTFTIQTFVNKSINHLGSPVS